MPNLKEKEFHFQTIKLQKKDQENSELAALKI